MTGNDIIARSLRLLGVIGIGNPTPSAYQSATGLLALNSLLGSLSNQRFTIYSVQRMVFDLTSNKQTYTCGPGGDFDMLRPFQVEEAGVILPTTEETATPFELPIQVLTDKQWAAVRIKALLSTQTFPYMIWPDGASPLQSIWTWPTPSVPCQIALYPWLALSKTTDPSASLLFPDGYEDMLAFNLAVNLGPEFNRDASPTVVARARETLSNIKIANIEPIYRQCDPGIARNVRGGAGYFNFLTGDQT